MRHVIGAVHPRHASKLSYGAIYRSLCNPSNKVSSIGRKRFNPAHHFHPSRLHSSLVFSHADFPFVYFVSKRSERWIESRGTLRICWKLEETSQMFLSKLLTRKSQSGCYDRGRNVYTFWKICYEMNMDVSINKKLYDEENNKIIIFVPCSKCIARNLFVAAMLLSIRLGVS